MHLGNQKKLKTKILKALEESPVPGVKIMERDSIVFILANGDRSGDNKETWKKIARILKKAFR